MLQSKLFKVAGKFVAGTLALLLALSQSVSAQSLTVTGKVVDASNEPIIGAGVVEKGTDNGTVTDIDGAFRLTVSGKNAVIVVNSLGYQTSEIVLGGRSSVNVVLKDDAQLLADAVVVGYGTQMRKTVCLLYTSPSPRDS